MSPLCSPFPLDIVNLNRPLFDDSMYLIDVSQVSTKLSIFLITSDNELSISGAVFNPYFWVSQILFDIQDGALLLKVRSFVQDL